MEEHLLRNTDDPNEVILLFEAADLQKAKEFAASSDLRERMQQAGVIDKPGIYFLEWGPWTSPVNSAGACPV